MGETIAWVTGCLVTVALIGAIAFLINIGMNNDYLLRKDCIAQGGVYSYGAGACTFSKQVQ